MAVKKCNPDEIGQVIAEMLETYTAEVGDEIKQLARKVGKEAKKRLQLASPVNKRSPSPHYAKSWKVKVVYEDRYQSRVAIHNAKYQLSHLLENGHQLRQGGRINAQPHVAPVQEWAEEEFVKGCEEILENAGH